jgi:hypothetical protein
MINIAKLTYRAYAILADGRQLNITGAMTAGGWNESEGEISTRTTMTVANVKFEGKPLSSVIPPGTIIAITADAGGGEKEVARGSVDDWSPSRSSGGNSLTLTAYDELYNLQQSQDDRYIPAGTGTKSAIMAVFSDWGVPVGEYKGPDKPHAKTIFKAQYLSDIILSLLDDAEKHGADHYVVRASAGKASILPVGSNEDIYHFSDDNNVTTTSDKITTASLVTRVKVMGLSDADGKAAPEAIVDGLTQYGIRQRIYNRSADDTLETAKAAAQAILDEQGRPERSSTLVGPDVPFIRKGDMVHLDTTALSGYFIIKSINHNITNRSMTMTVEPAAEEPLQTSATPTPVEEPGKQQFQVGDKVRVRDGARTFNGETTLQSWCYNFTFDVIQVGGKGLSDDRIVIGIGRAVTAAMNAADLYPA